MRILTIGPIFGGGIPLVEDIIEAIQTLAIEHRTLNEPDWVQAYQVAAKARNPLPFYAKVHQALDQALDEFAPDLVLTFALAPLPPGFGQKLKGRGIKSVHWFFEDGRRFPTFERMASEHTEFFAIQPWVAAFLQEKGVDNARYLPLGVPIRCQDTTLTRANEPDIPLAFVGTPSARRVELFSQLTEFGLKLWGPGWDQTNDQLKACGQEGGRWLSRDEERDIYLRASLVVNLHQDSGREGAPDFINPRTFVLAALGVPQVLEDRLELAPLFDLTNELTVFRPATDLSALVREHLQNSEKREKQAQRAKERALSEHLLQHRVAQLLDM